MSGYATTDLCDANDDALATGELQVLTPGLRSFGKRGQFAGPAVTLRLFEDNSLLAEAVKTPGEGRVLVIDAGGSMRCGVFGGNLAQAAQRNGWAGLIIWGAVRDVGEIGACDVGVLALGTHPRRSIKRGVGERDVPVVLLGARIRPGMWVYADADGVVVSSKALHD